MTKILLSHKKTSISHAILFFRCHEKTSVFVQSFFFGRLFFQKGLFGCSIIIEVPTSKKGVALLARKEGWFSILAFWFLTHSAKIFFFSQTANWDSTRQLIFLLLENSESCHFFLLVSTEIIFCESQKELFCEESPDHFFFFFFTQVELELTQVSEGSYFDPWSGLPGRGGGVKFNWQLIFLVRKKWLCQENFINLVRAHSLLRTWDVLFCCPLPPRWSKVRGKNKINSLSGCVTILLF